MAAVPVALSENEMLSGKLTIARFDFISTTAAAVEEVVDSVVVVPAGGMVWVVVEDAIVEVAVVTAALAGGGGGGTGSVSGVVPQPAASVISNITTARKGAALPFRCLDPDKLMGHHIYLPPEVDGGDRR
jgi:hypothetical protein